MKRYLVLDVGCAECGDDLVGVAGVADTLDEAKALSNADLDWKTSEGGDGIYQSFGDGECRIIDLHAVDAR